MIIQWEKPFRQWLNDQLKLPPLGRAGSVMSGFPLGTPQWPVIVCTRLGGAPEWSEDVPRVRVRVWGNTKDEAEGLAVRIAQLIDNADGMPTILAPGVVMRATDIEQISWEPDPGLANQPSYLVSATLVFTDR